MLRRDLLEVVAQASVSLTNQKAKPWFTLDSRKKMSSSVRVSSTQTLCLDKRNGKLPERAADHRSPTFVSLRVG